MYIKIENSERIIPVISFIKNKDRSNVIKKNDLQYYNEAQELVLAIKNRLFDYQSLFEKQVLLMLEDKEQSLNDHINKLFINMTESWSNKKNDCLLSCEVKVNEWIKNQAIAIEEYKESIKREMIFAIKNRMSKLIVNDTLVDHIVEILSSEIKSISSQVNIIDNKNGKLLTVENENEVFIFDTYELLEELRCSLDLI